MTTSNLKTLLSASLLLITTSPAFAHTGIGTTHGFMDGFSHPWQGLDHFLVMFAVGLWACVLGGRMMWAVPASFLALMAMGTSLGFAGFEFRAAEQSVALSVLVFGLILWRNWKTSMVLAMSLVGAFALCHGYVHAAELSAGSDQIGYAAGFLLTTALLHGLGIGSGLLGTKTLLWLRIIVGLVSTVVGVVLLAG